MTLPILCGLWAGGGEGLPLGFPSSFSSRQLPGPCGLLSVKALAAVQSFISSGAGRIGVLRAQNSLRQLHPVHLKVPPQVLADGPKQLFNSCISETEGHV